MANKSLSKSVYDAIYAALEEGDYLQIYPICKGYHLKLYDSENESEPYFEKAVELHSPNGVEVFTICWDRREQAYRVQNYAELFSGTVDIILGCAVEISKWIADENPQIATGALL